MQVMRSISALTNFPLTKCFTLLSGPLDTSNSHDISGPNLNETGPASAEEANAIHRELKSAKQLQAFNQKAINQMLGKNLRFQQEIEELKKQLEIEANAAR